MLMSFVYHADVDKYLRAIAFDVYTLCLKKRPTLLTCYNLDLHDPSIAYSIGNGNISAK